MQRRRAATPDISKSEGGLTYAMTYSPERVQAPATFGSNFTQYDKNGNLTYSSGPYPASGYAFDPENRLTSAVGEVVPV